MNYHQPNSFEPNSPNLWLSLKGIALTSIGVVVLNLANVFCSQCVLLYMFAGIVWNVGYIISCIGFWKLFDEKGLVKAIALATFIIPLIPLFYYLFSRWSRRRIG